jgi:hypothetical protein
MKRYNLKRYQIYDLGKKEPRLLKRFGLGKTLVDFAVFDQLIDELPPTSERRLGNEANLSRRWNRGSKAAKSADDATQA